MNTSDDSRGYAVRTYFAWEKALWRDPELLRLSRRSSKSKDLRVTAMVTATFGSLGRRCLPRASTVAAYAGCDERTVREHWKLLVDRGWFRLFSRPGMSGIYYIALPVTPEDMAAGAMTTPEPTPEDINTGVPRKTCPPTTSKGNQEAHASGEPVVSRKGRPYCYTCQADLSVNDCSCRNYTWACRNCSQDAVERFRSNDLCAYYCAECDSPIVSLENGLLPRTWEGSWQSFAVTLKARG